MNITEKLPKVPKVPKKPLEKNKQNDQKVAQKRFEAVGKAIKNLDQEMNEEKSRGRSKLFFFFLLLSFPLLFFLFSFSFLGRGPRTDHDSFYSSHTPSPFPGPPQNDDDAERLPNKIHLLIGI